MKKFGLILILVQAVISQVVSDHTYTGADAMSLAGAVTANPGSPSSIFHNPGSLAELQTNFITFGHTDLLGVPYTYLGAGYLTEKYGMVGISLQQSKVTAGSADLSKETDLGLSSGFYLRNDKNSKLMLGYTLHAYSWTLGHSAGPTGDGSDGFASSSGNAVGADIGIQAVLRGKHRVGAWIKNINSPVIGDGNSSQYLPRRMSLGIAYLPYKGLTTSLVFDRLIGEEIQVKGGIEYDLTKLWVIRYGIQSNPNRMGAGFGLRYAEFTLDYALITHPVLPVIQQLSLGYNF